jgi:hypothetical protein
MISNFLFQLNIIMNIHKIITKTLFSITLLISSVAFANDYYIGAGIGASNLKPNVSGIKSQIDTAFKLTLGANLNENFAAELSYANLGTNDDISPLDYKYTSLGVVYNHNLDNSSITPFIGAGWADFSTNRRDLIDKDDQYYATVGIQFDLDDESDLDYRLSYTRYAQDAKTIMAEVLSKF